MPSLKIDLPKIENIYGNQSLRLFAVQSSPLFCESSHVWVETGSTDFSHFMPHNFGVNLNTNHSMCVDTMFTSSLFNTFFTMVNGL